GSIESDCLTQQIHLDGRSQPLSIHYVQHHRCHAAAAFFPSPFEQASVLTVDGFGERAATTLGRFHDPNGSGSVYEPMGSIDFPQSLGSFYAAITGWLGFRPNSGEGKVMGLAPYGDDTLVDRFRQILRVGQDGDQPYHLDLSWFDFYLDGPSRVSDRFLDEFGPAIAAGTSDYSDHAKAVAAAAQQVTEEAILSLARHLQARTGDSQLVLAGGVAMNSVANGRLEREGPYDALWVQPSSGDGGTAVGAALWVWHSILGRSQRHQWVNDRFGPAYSPEACRAALRRGGWSFAEPEDIASDTAAALERGELVGWFQGPAELGARALGGRSIVADPRAAGHKDILNSRVKFREAFRPFAPSVLEDRASELFEIPSGGTVPYMQKVHPVRPEARSSLGGVTHVDGTARLQTVSRESDSLYYDLIEAFDRLTGVPAVLNTSFNVRGEPMVGTPDDAIRCWATTGLDRLVLGPCVVSKGER
ncbi:MAG TPA: carbamoyltransferase, partial [Deltaproteobacteria bacterium]|nr:carbamoyltransferase [Deltaproteobacteria bacterium]